MPETITREERLAAIKSLLPPRKVVQGREQPYNSKAYNTISDLLEMVENDMLVIQGMTAREVPGSKPTFASLPDIPKPAKLTLDSRAHTLLHLAWTMCVTCGHGELAKAIQGYLLAEPQVVQENLVT